MGLVCLGSSNDGGAIFGTFPGNGKSNPPTCSSDENSLAYEGSAMEIIQIKEKIIGSIIGPEALLINAQSE